MITLTWSNIYLYTFRVEKQSIIRYEFLLVVTNWSWNMLRVTIFVSCGIYDTQRATTFVALWSYNTLHAIRSLPKLLANSLRFTLFVVSWIYDTQRATIFGTRWIYNTPYATIFVACWSSNTLHATIFVYQTIPKLEHAAACCNFSMLRMS